MLRTVRRYRALCAKKAPIHRTLRPGGRHYSENWRAWQTVKKANLVRLIKVSLFDPGVSRKSPISWHFWAVLGLQQPVTEDLSVWGYHLPSVPQTDPVA